MNLINQFKPIEAFAYERSSTTLFTNGGESNSHTRYLDGMSNEPRWSNTNKEHLGRPVGICKVFRSWIIILKLPTVYFL